MIQKQVVDKVMGFMDFIREQGVVGLAIGFLLGGAISKLVTALVTDFINPILGLIMGSKKGFENIIIPLGPNKILIGHFVGVLIDFIVIASVVYFIVRGFNLDKLDKKKGA